MTQVIDLFEALKQSLKDVAPGQLSNPVERLHQSYSRDLLYGCPLELKQKLDRGRGASSKACDDGTLVHQLVLGGKSRMHVMQATYERGRGKTKETVRATDMTSGAAKAERDEALARGLIPVFEKHHTFLMNAAGAIIEQLLAKGYDLRDAENEVTHQWTSSLGVSCEGTPDSRLRGVTLDLKCPSKPFHPRQLVRDIWQNCYDVQGAAYEELPALAPGPRTHLLAVAPLIEPIRVHLVPLSEGFLELGRKRWELVQRRWQRCIDSGEWPDYPDEPARPETWMMSDVENQLMEADDEEV